MASKESESLSLSSSVHSASSDDGSDVPPDDGEYAILAATLLDIVVSSESGSRSGTMTPPRTSNQNGSMADDDTFYGSPLSKEEAEKSIPPGGGGLMWNALIIPDNFCSSNGKLMRGLNQRDYDLANRSIKPRRASLPITVTQLFSSMTKIDGPEGPRYIFNGILNGWPSLRTFELLKLEKKRSIGPLAPPDYMNSSKLTWAHYWGVDDEIQKDPAIVNADEKKIFRAKLRAAPWTSIGWSPESPGFMFWYEAQRPEGPRVTYGTSAVESVGDDKCTMVHMISHRYAVAKEKARDKVTYHSFVLLEWEHGNYCTVIEGAYLNGIGGYRGRCNWYHDRDEPETELYKALPPEMICPWLTTAAEVRCYDVEAKNLEEMKEYITKYEGGDKRFLDPKYTFSHPARLFFRSKSNIAQYLVNYIVRDSSYSELKRNCQTLAADLCCFIAGKKDVAPYHPINRIEYHNRTHLFLYDSTMFSRRNPTGAKKMS